MSLKKFCNCVKSRFHIKCCFFKEQQKRLKYLFYAVILIFFFSNLLVIRVKLYMSENFLLTFWNKKKKDKTVCALSTFLYLFYFFRVKNWPLWGLRQISYKCYFFSKVSKQHYKFKVFFFFLRMLKLSETIKLIV